MNVPVPVPIRPVPGVRSRVRRASRGGEEMLAVVEDVIKLISDLVPLVLPLLGV